MIVFVFIGADRGREDCPISGDRVSSWYNRLALTRFMTDVYILLKALEYVRAYIYVSACAVVSFF